MIGEGDEASGKFELRVKPAVAPQAPALTTVSADRMRPTFVSGLCANHASERGSMVSAARALTPLAALDLLSFNITISAFTLTPVMLAGVPVPIVTTVCVGVNA